jgi:4a-hydroxytetrahydrobiopterin dehydratase
VALYDKKCAPCEGSAEPMKRREAEKLLAEAAEWQIIEEPFIPKLQRLFEFRDFKEAMKFVNKVAEIAESEGHHPDIEIKWNKVTLTLYTHSIKGLSENDFIVAAKINGFIDK